MANITSKTGRAKLAVHREPYWSRVSTGVYIGFRKLEEGEGTWIGRYQDRMGTKAYKSFGSLAGDKQYDDAVKLVTTWAQSLEQGVTNKTTTVKQACETYVEDRRTRKSKENAKDAEGRFKRLVYNAKIGAVPLDKLTPTMVKQWLNAQLDDEDEETLRRSKDSANRNLAALKAALNMALKDRLVATDAGWRTVTPFRGVSRRRTEFLTLKQRKALLEACPEDLQLLVKAMLLTGARPGELAKVTVKDYDKAQGTIALTGKTGHRVCTLSSEARKLFRAASKNKLPAALLLPRADGKAWDRHWWKKLFTEAVKTAKLPQSVVLYVIRHTAISEMIAGGMDSFLVARLAGTSTAMIDRHYGHLRHDRTRQALDTVKLL